MVLRNLTEHLTFELMAAFVADGLSEEEERGADEHLRHCEICNEQVLRLFNDAQRHEQTSLDAMDTFMPRFWKAAAVPTNSPDVCPGPKPGTP